MSTTIRLSMAALLAFTAAACATSPTGRRQLALVSEESAIVASEEAYAMQIGELRKEGKIVPESSRVARRVEGITERLVAQAVEMRPETADWDWSMEVIDDPDVVNAWCMAGGRMAVYTGLIRIGRVGAEEVGLLLQLVGVVHPPDHLAGMRASRRA